MLRGARPLEEEDGPFDREAVVAAAEVDVMTRELA